MSGPGHARGRDLGRVHDHVARPRLADDLRRDAVEVRALEVGLQHLVRRRSRRRRPPARRRRGRAAARPRGSAPTGTGPSAGHEPARLRVPKRFDPNALTSASPTGAAAASATISTSPGSIRGPLPQHAERQSRRAERDRRGEHGQGGDAGQVADAGAVDAVRVGQHPVRERRADEPGRERLQRGEDVRRPRVMSPRRPGSQGAKASAATAVATSAGRRAAGCAHSAHASWAASGKTLV